MSKKPIHTTLMEKTVRTLMKYSTNGSLNSGIENAVKLLNHKERLNESDETFLNNIADRIVMNGGHENGSDVLRLRNITKYGFESC